MDFLLPKQSQHLSQPNYVILTLICGKVYFVQLKSSLRKVYGRNYDLVNYMYNGISVTSDICSTCRKHFPALSLFMTYHRVCNWSNTTGGTSGAGTAYPSGASEFTLSF